MMVRRHGVFFVAAALVLIGPLVFTIAQVAARPRVARALALPIVERQAAAAQATSELALLARRDPKALVRMGRERYEREVRDYRCVLVKQELLDGGMSEVQTIELRFRAEPFAVYMLWLSNPDGARRALHMKTDAYVESDGDKLVRIEPNGAVARLFTTDLFLPINSDPVRKESRRGIDEAGFHATFELFEAFNAVAEKKGVLDLRYAGEGQVDGRPTFVLTRELPYEGPEGPYPDARLVMHLDQGWLLPVAVYSYADREERQLLGSYVFTRVELNPGLTDKDFAF